MPQFPLYLRNADVLSDQTSQSLVLFRFVLFFLHKNMLKDQLFKTSGVAFRARKVNGTFEKLAPGHNLGHATRLQGLIKDTAKKILCNFDLLTLRLHG